MTDPPVKDFFVSYTGADVAWADWVARTLEDAGYSVIYQKGDFRAGNFRADIESTVRRSRRIVPILSQAYLQSAWCTLEWTTFINDPGLVIPVTVQDIEDRTLLANLNRVNLVGLGEVAAAEKLLARMAQLLSPPDGPTRAGPAPLFPGTVKRIAPDIPPPRAPAGEPVQRIAAGRVALLVLGTLDGSGVTVDDIRRVVGADVLHDLHGSERTAAEQRSDVENLLAGLDEDVTDVVAVLAGRGSPVSDVGPVLYVRSSDAGKTSASIGLRPLVELLDRQLARRRVHVLLDVRHTDGQSVGPGVTGKVPVLDLLASSDPAAAAGGLVGLVDVLGEPPERLAGRLGHWSRLGLGDLKVLSGGTLVRPQEWEDAEVGLLPNPLAWPHDDEDDATRWCFVLSAAESRTADKKVAYALSQLEMYSRKRLAKDPALEPQAARCHAADVLACPATFARAVRQVCRADIAVFDVTNYEPAVMVLLGIRAVIRRGVTLCVHGRHDKPWVDKDAPFHLREVSILAELDYRKIEDRLKAGLRHLSTAKRTIQDLAYQDLPAFELIRAVPVDEGRRTPRPFDRDDRTMLALVPFGGDYDLTNWTLLAKNLPDAATDPLMADEETDGADEGEDDADEDDAERPRLLRSLDLDSPRVVSAQLYEAIRLNDFCLVDVSGPRANVLFELGVRLAANALHPIVVHDPSLPVEDLGPDVRAQHAQLLALLAAIRYGREQADLPTYGQMVARHVELRRLLAGGADQPRWATVLGGFPPRGVHDLAWRFARARDEQVAMPVVKQLLTAAKSVLVDPSRGERPFRYPTELARTAEDNGRERLIAAWLYQRHRLQAATSDDPEISREYAEVTKLLVQQFEGSDEEDDPEFADWIEMWRAGARMSDRVNRGPHG